MSQGQKKRILVVDDSAVMRSLLRSVIATDSTLEIVGTASDGESALKLMESLHPDLVLLDVEMPILNGLETLRKMKARNLKMQVIMCSALTQRGAKVTIESLASGASDYVGKPSSQLGPAVAIQNLAHELIPKIHALTGKSGNAPAFNTGPAPSAPARSLLPGMITNPAAVSAIANQQITATPNIVVIGISTGGPAALDVLLPALPANFPLPVLVVQHMPELFTHLLAERLHSRCPLEVREAKTGDPVKAGTIYIARGNWHMEVMAPKPKRPDGAFVLNLTQAAPENHCRPAADVLFRTAAENFGAGVLGVVMTGMGSDGLIGSRLIRQKGGSILAQDHATSAVWGMPGAVTQAGVSQKVLPLDQIAPEIIRLAGRGPKEAKPLREAMVG